MYFGDKPAPLPGTGTLFTTSIIRSPSRCICLVHPDHSAAGSLSCVGGALWPLRNRQVFVVFPGRLAAKLLSVSA